MFTVGRSDAGTTRNGKLLSATNEATADIAERMGFFDRERGGADAALDFMSDAASFPAWVCGVSWCDGMTFSTCVLAAPGSGTSELPPSPAGAGIAAADEIG
jgi:hypothetical protein